MTSWAADSLTLALVALAVAACNDKPRGGVDAAPPKAASADPDAQLPANARVALTKLAGTSNTDRAVIEAQGAVRRNMDQNDAWVVLGHAWIDKARESREPGFYLNADACASVVLAKDRDHAAAADLRGALLLRRQEFADARSLADRITAKHPDDPRAWGNASDVLLALGRYDEATDAAQNMLDLAPDVRSYGRLSYLRWLHGDVARAKQLIQSAIYSEPGASILVQAAMISWHEGDYDAADASFDRALVRVADFAPALAGKGRVAMARGEFPRAVELFARSYEAAPAIETAWLLGDAREAAGDPKGAEEAYALVAKGRADDPRTYSLFVSSKKERTERERGDAVEIASQVHVKRNDVYTEDALAWALYRAGMLEPAKSTMGRAQRLHTPDARILFHEGAIRIAAGDVTKGKALVTTALAMNRAFDWREAREARALVR